MKVLVTGGAGFIASHVVDALIANGHEVVVVDNLSTGKRENLNPSARFYQMDIRDPGLDRVLATERPDVVNHHAAQAAVPRSVEDPTYDAQVNILGSLNLLQASVRHGVRKFVYISTGGAIYGNPDSLPCTEDHPVRPLSPYGASKYAVEPYLAVYRQTFGLDFTVLRYGNVYGPRMHFEAQEGLVAAMFASRMVRGDTVTIDGTGEQSRDFVYVSDVARANLLALQKGAGRVYNIGTGRATTVNQIFGILRDLAGYRLQPVFGPPRKGDVFQVYLDVSRAARELDWVAEVSIEEGLARTLDYFRALLA